MNKMVERKEQGEIQENAELFKAVRLSSLLT